MTKPALAQYWSDAKEDGRAYRHPHTGLRVPSVTTITGLADKSGLAQYAADRTLRFASENWSWLASNSDEQIFRGGRFRWRDHADDRANVGNEVHDWIEAWISNAFVFPELGHDAQQCVDRFIEFTGDHDFEPLYAEVTVWSHEHEYAGTFDWLGYLDGHLTLGDTKTSRRLVDEHRMQLAALSRADTLLIESEGEYTEIELPEVESLAFLHLRPDEYDPLYRRNESSFYAVEYLPMVERDAWFEAFLGYRHVFNAQQDIKALRKAAGDATLVNE